MSEVTLSSKVISEMDTMGDVPGTMTAQQVFAWAKEQITALRTRAETAEAQLATAEWEREQIALAICGGEDAPGYAASLSVENLKKVIADRLDAKEWTDTQIAQLATLQAGRKTLSATEEVITLLRNTAALLNDPETDNWTKLQICDVVEQMERAMVMAQERRATLLSTSGADR